MAASDPSTLRSHNARLEALGTMASGIAHEINSPIQFIGDNLQFINDSFSAIDRLLKSYEALHKAARDQGVLEELTSEASDAHDEADIDYLREELPSAIEQSLSGIQQVSRIASAMKTFAHRGATEKEMADINQAIELTAAVCRNEWKYVADLDLDLDPSLPAIPCHIGELSQVWLNLIVNAAHAIKAQPNLPRGLIRVVTSASDHAVQVSIHDNGIGIPDNVRDQIFESFFSTKEAGEGSGQGLAISLNIVAEQHGGEIDVATEVGKGTCFTVSLPLHANNQASAPREKVMA